MTLHSFVYVKDLVEKQKKISGIFNNKVCFLRYHEKGVILKYREMYTDTSSSNQKSVIKCPLDSPRRKIK